MLTQRGGGVKKGGFPTLRMFQLPCPATFGTEITQEGGHPWTRPSRPSGSPLLKWETVALCSLSVVCYISKPFCLASLLQVGGGGVVGLWLRVEWLPHCSAVPMLRSALVASTPFAH